MDEVEGRVDRVGEDGVVGREPKIERRWEGVEEGTGSRDPKGGVGEVERTRKKVKMF